MAQDPREAFARYQRQLQQRFKPLRGGGFPGGPGPAGIAGGAAGLLAIAGGFLIYNSLYNGQ